MSLQTYRTLRAARTAGAYFRPSVLRRLAVFLLLALPLAWLLVLRERSQLADSAREESQRNVQNLARAFAEEVGSSMVTIDLSLSRLSGRWTVQFLRPIFDKAGKGAGVIVSGRTTGWW